MNDSLGVPVELGDTVLSASTTHGRVKIGLVEAGPEGRFRMEVKASFHWGKQETSDRHPKRQAFGTNVIVLRKADGSIPEPVRMLYA